MSVSFRTTLKDSPKVMKKRKKEDPEQKALVRKLSRITGYSERQIERVIKAESENERVLDAYMFLHEGNNRLVEAVKELVPF